FELRLADGAANPYLLQAAIIAAGLSGLINKADPGPKSDFDMYADAAFVPDARRLPLNLLDALRTFDADTELKEALGESFAGAYVKLKTQEWHDYTAHFSDWERTNTLDI
ncbi:MAG: type III glutamate--ammonia ligase, partial [Pseudomonadota bacterium]